METDGLKIINPMKELREHVISYLGDDDAFSKSEIELIDRALQIGLEIETAPQPYTPEPPPVDFDEALQKVSNLVDFMEDKMGNTAKLDEAEITRDIMAFVLQLMSTAKQELRPQHGEDKENLRAQYLTLHNACMTLLTGYVLTMTPNRMKEQPND